MTQQPWYPYAPDQEFGRRAALDQARLEEFLVAVGQLDVPMTMAGSLDAAADVRAPAIRREGRAGR
jgi:hypothetical protein